MAKKESGKTDVPVVTSLPLPSSDSVLVIDLPDGQKLLVGKMEPGSVIEVATWRGTGRPDSRTNRLMLGMSNGENPENPETATTSEEIGKLSWQYGLYVIRNIPPFILQFSTQLLGKIKSRKSESSKNEIQTPNEDIEAWLTKITSSLSHSEASGLNTELVNKTNSKKSKKTPESRKSTAKRQVKKR